MAAFPILKKRVMTPKIPQPQYRLAASVSIKGSQVGLARCAPADRPRLSPAVRGCHSFQRLLPLQSELPAGKLASKDPVGIGIKAKTIFFQKTRQKFRHLIVPDQIYYCVYQISTVWLGPIHCKYIQTVKVQSDHCKLYFCWTCYWTSKLSSFTTRLDQPTCMDRN